MYVKVSPVSRMSSTRMTFLPSIDWSTSLTSFTSPLCCLRAAVAGNGNEVEAAVQLDLAGQVGEKDGRALQHADQHDGFAGEVGGDLRAKFGNFGGNLVAR